MVPGNEQTRKFFKPKKGGRGEQPVIKFDRDARVEFLTGFKKRKDERRVQAKEKSKKELKQERKEMLDIKKQQKANIEQQYEEIREMKKAEFGGSAVVAEGDDDEGNKSDAEESDDIYERM